MSMENLFEACFISLVFLPVVSLAVTPECIESGIDGGFANSKPDWKGATECSSSRMDTTCPRHLRPKHLGTDPLMMSPWEGGVEEGAPTRASR